MAPSLDLDLLSARFTRLPQEIQGQHVGQLRQKTRKKKPKLIGILMAEQLGKKLQKHL